MTQSDDHERAFRQTAPHPFEDFPDEDSHEHSQPIGRGSPLHAITGNGSIEHQLHVVYETSHDALLVLDDERRCVHVNEEGIRLLGASPEIVLRRRLDHFTPRERWATLERLWAELRAAGQAHGPYEVLRGDGSRTMIEYRATWDFGPAQHLLAARASGAGRNGHNGSRPLTHAPTLKLTPREREVLQLAADGQSAPDIALVLVLSIGTVKTHFQHIYKKLGAHDRAGAVAECMRRGLIE